MLQVLIISLLLTSCALGAPGSLSVIHEISGLDGRIIGGEDAVIEDYPYQVQLIEGMAHICGGAIISPDYVLTAAHCIRWPASTYSVRAGSSFRNYDGIVIGARQITVHPDYNSDLENDIAIILLSSSLPFSASIASIGLPAQNQAIPTGANAIVTGWGDLFEGANQGSSVLQAVAVPIVNQPECEVYYANHRYSVTDNMICAGFLAGGRDACQGDSGGPLVVNGQLVGIVSWGEGCAQPDYPGVYASVPYLRYFIEENTGI